MMRNVLLILAAIGLALGCSPRDPQVERTVDKNVREMESQLNTHILSVYPAGGKVSFVSDGTFGVYEADQKWQREFALEIGEQFQSQADHHILSIFELRKVQHSSLILKYSSTFDERSFGQNRITVDEGKVEIPFKGNK